MESFANHSLPRLIMAVFSPFFEGHQFVQVSSVRSTCHPTGYHPGLPYLKERLHECRRVYDPSSIDDDEEECHSCCCCHPRPRLADILPLLLSDVFVIVFVIALPLASYRDQDIGQSRFDFALSLQLSHFAPHCLR